MTDFLLRAEDIPNESILDYFVETEKDRYIVEALKRRSPVLLEGSRGVGKSLLLRVCDRELSDRLPQDRILPVYVQLTKSILVNTSNESQFHYWTLARLAVGLLRSLRNHGIAINIDHEVSILGGDPKEGSSDPINETLKDFERSYLNRNIKINISKIPGVEQFKFGVEDICRKTNLQRIVVLFDEAAHVLQPEHQRQFFTLFRDLRSPYVSCNAAVYPGIMSYGDTFEQSHDATTVRVERDVRSEKYRDEMRSIVDVQAGSETMKHVERQGPKF